MMRVFATLVASFILFQNCTPWPAATSLLDLIQADRKNSPLLIPHPGKVNPQQPSSNSDSVDSNVTPGTLQTPGNGSYTFTENVSISPVIFSGDNLVSCSIDPPLPPGLSLDSTTCTITGIPAPGSSGTTVYTVTGTFAGGGSTTSQITITIQPQGVTSLAVTSPSGPWPHTFYTGNLISIVFTATGGAIATNGCTLQSVPNLPSGWTLSRTSDTTCTISGSTNDTSSQTSYTIRAANPYGYAETTIQFQVDAAP